MQPGFTLGKTGDFTTAPEISPLFADCFGRQCEHIFAGLETKNMLEIGAGSGQFACDVLNYLIWAQCPPEQYYILEISPALRLQQQAKLRAALPNFFNRIIWLDQLPNTFTGVVIANEVLDALPVDCFRIENNHIMQRSVAWKENAFAWKLTETMGTPLHTDVEAIVRECHVTDGYESEINLQLEPFLASLAKSLTQGVILFADYGYGRAEYYHPQRRQGTLTCFYRHRRHNNPLIWPGLQDMTAHVDFTRTAESAIDHGLRVAGYTSQAAFLLGLGLTELASAKESTLSDADQFQLHQAIKTLTLPTEMGERIKIMALTKNVDTPLLGFSLHDRRRNL
jgi:SAM-dependent MidA family methyltransferase